MAKLYLKFESAVIKVIPLTKDETTFGRKPSNDIVIDHPTVSGFHGKICKEGDGYSVYDLNSTNGTFINGHRVVSGPLRHKDQVGVAKHILEVVLLEEPAQPEAPAPSGNGQGSGDELPDNLRQASKALLKGDDGQAAPKADSGADVHGVVKIIAGAVDNFTEVKLRDLVTYIGTSDKAAIKIKGILAPSLAAAISRRPDGYFLKAVKPGYPKVNGNPVKEQVFLENGALIEAGGTNMVFYRSDAKKEKTTGE